MKAAWDVKPVSWAFNNFRDHRYKSKHYISEVRIGIVEDSEPDYTKIMAVPVYQISSIEAHPKATHQSSGVLVSVLDTGLLAKRFVEGKINLIQKKQNAARKGRDFLVHFSVASGCHGNLPF